MCDLTSHKSDPARHSHMRCHNSQQRGCDSAHPGVPDAAAAGIRTGHQQGGNVLAMGAAEGLCKHREWQGFPRGLQGCSDSAHMCCYLRSRGTAKRCTWCRSSRRSRGTSCWL